jgi:Protein of unknown function (DUF3592)
MPGRSTSRMRFARVMLWVQLAGMAVGTIALVYFLGFGVRPRQVGSTFLIAACYLVFTGITTFFMQRVWRAQARRAAANAAHQAVGALTMDNVGGLGRPGMRKGLRSLRRAWLPLTLLGAAMLIAFLVLVDHYEGSALALQSSGVHVEGVITSVTGQEEAPRDGAVDVQYSYAGQTFDTRVYRDDTSPFYHVGEAVTVTLDPSDPQVATVGGSDNEGPAVVWLLIVLLLGGGVAVLLGFAILIGMWRARLKARGATVQADHPA